MAELPYALRRALHDHSDFEGLDYDLIIVDEYQDLNACDLELLHLIGDRGCSIIGAGDDDQSIYNFRYADPEGIRRFEQDYPGCAVYPLSITQRCGRRIIELASYVIAGDPDRPDRPALTPAEGSPEGEVALLAFPGEITEARGIASLIRQLIDRDGVEPEEILVLLRGDHNGTFSRPIKEALDAVGVGYSDPDAIDRILTEKDSSSSFDGISYAVDTGRLGIQVFLPPRQLLVQTLLLQSSNFGEPKTCLLYRDHF